MQLARKSVVLSVIALLFVFMGASLSAAQEVVQPDGRLNQVTHFGGDAFYCVDGDFQPTYQYSDFDEGGFRLLNMFGQELWFVPALQVSAAVAEAKETGMGVLVGEGNGTYGPVSVYTYVTGENDDYFIFSGYDEFGKANSITFKFCQPVGPTPEEPEVFEEPCVVYVYYASKALTDVKGINGGIPVPCEEFDECDPLPAPGKVLSKRMSAVPGPVPLDPCYPDDK